MAIIIIIIITTLKIKSKRQKPGVSDINVGRGVIAARL